MLRRISVHPDREFDGDQRFETALSLAKRHNAELTGIYAGYQFPEYLYDESVKMTALFVDVVQEHEKTRVKVETQFRIATKTAGVTAFWRYAGPGLAEQVALHARNSDLLIVGQYNSEDKAAISDHRFVQNLLLSTGRPVLVVPKGRPYTDLGRRVLYCWDRGRESARALADAAPILKEATELIVLTVDPESSRIHTTGVPFDDLSAYCTAHNYPSTTLVEMRHDGGGTGQTILKAAHKYDCDLIVMGAYGHNKLQELVMGGATRTLLASMTMPVLFSH
jgi:nucleotide-binding universal stress UspA family protein